MDITTIKEKVIHFLVEDFELDEAVMTDEAQLKQDVGLDSLDFVDIIVCIEREFAFKPDAADLKKLKTLADLYAYIKSHTNA